MKHNYRILFSLLSLFLSLSDQILGDLSDMLRKRGSRELATISGVDREPNDKCYNLSKSNRRDDIEVGSRVYRG